LESSHARFFSNAFNTGSIAELNSSSYMGTTTLNWTSWSRR